MTLSTTVFGGESPNDRISTILAVMTNISERVDKLVGKVGNMESQVNNIDHMEKLTARKVSKMEDRMKEIVQEGAGMKKDMDERMDSMDTKLRSVSCKVDSMDTKMAMVDQDVKMNGWRYLGRGHLIGGIVEESGQGAQTLSQCCQICEDKHSADHQWNGFIWEPSDGSCWCEKNDKGHDPNKYQENYMHFFKKIM